MLIRVDTMDHTWSTTVVKKYTYIRADFSERLIQLTYQPSFYPCKTAIRICSTNCIKITNPGIKKPSPIINIIKIGGRASQHTETKP